MMTAMSRTYHARRVFDIDDAAEQIDARHLDEAPTPWQIEAQADAEQRAIDDAIERDQQDRFGPLGQRA
jgi:hypothetical protein